MNREEAIERILNLTDEQFKQLLTLYSQPDQETLEAAEIQTPASA